MALNITVTDAGRAEIINAQNTGTAPVTISHIALGRGRYTPEQGQTALVDKITRLDTIAGEVVAADTIHVVIKDEGDAAYSVGEFGLITESGTLFAVFSQPGSEWIIDKASPTTLLLAVDVILDSLDATSVQFGDASFTNPPASETVRGVVELADHGEALAGSDTLRAMTPRRVHQAFQQFGLGAAGDTTPMLNDFADAATPGGLYRALGEGTSTPTPNGPPGTGNNRLSALAIPVSGVGLHWIVQENSGVPGTSHRLFFGNTHSGAVVWNQVWHNGNVTPVDQSRALVAGNGLSGGGDLSANRTLHLGTPNTLSAASTNAVTPVSHTHAIDATSARTDSSTARLLTAAAMNDHRTSGDHDGRYARRGSNLADLASAATARDNLGLGNAATRAVQSGAVDTTPGRLLAVGAFGLGNTGTAAGITNFNQHHPAGIYHAVGVGATNPPITENQLLAVTVSRPRADMTVYVATNYTGDTYIGVYTESPVVWRRVITREEFTSGLNWHRLPDGRIHQYGVSPQVAVNSHLFVNFPIAFPNVCRAVTVTIESSVSNTNGAHSMYVNEVGVSGFRLRHDDTKGENRPLRAYWQAVGY